MGRDERNNLIGMPGGKPLVGAGGRLNLQPRVVRDAMGRELTKYDQVIFTDPILRSYAVESIEAVIETGQPDGLMDVVVVSRMKLRTPRNMPIIELVRIATAAERGQAQVTPIAEPEEPEPERPAPNDGEEPPA